MLRVRVHRVVVAIALVATVLLIGSSGHAQTVAPAQGAVLLALDHGLDDDRTVALRAELGLRALALELVPTLAGEDAPRREAHARLLAQQRGAYATLWIDGAEARAVTPAGPMQRALLPRPAATIDARVLAVLLASLLDEALSPPSVIVVVPATSDVAEPAATPEVAPAPSADRAPASETATASTGAYLGPAPHAFDDTDDPHDGDVHPYAIVDAAVGAVWSLGEQDNVAHLAQRVGAGLLAGDLRGELVVAPGLDQSMDGGYESGFLFDVLAYLGASLPTGFAALDLGGQLGMLFHSLVDARTPADGLLTAFRVGGVVGLTMRDSLTVFPFRARIELGAFARPDPSRFAPYTNVILGIAFW